MGRVSRELVTALSTEMRDVLEPFLKEIESLNESIKEYEERVEKIGPLVSKVHSLGSEL